MSAASVVLSYFPIRGRAEPIRLLMEDAGISYTQALDMEVFKAEKMDCAKYPFNQLPVLTVDGEVVAQQDAVLRYFAAISGQGGNGDLKENLRVDMLGCAVEDLARAYTGAIYSPECATLLVTFANEQAVKSFSQYEHILSNSSSKAGYMAYEYPSWAEYHLLAIVQSILVLRPDILAGFPLLSRWYSVIVERKGIKAYLASGRQPEMINGSSSGQKAVC